MNDLGQGYQHEDKTYKSNPAGMLHDNKTL